MMIVIGLLKIDNRKSCRSHFLYFDIKLALSDFKISSLRLVVVLVNISFL